MSLSTGWKIGIGLGLAGIAAWAIAALSTKKASASTTIPGAGGGQPTPVPGGNNLQPDSSGHLNLVPGAMGTITMMGDKVAGTPPFFADSDINLYAPGSPLSGGGSMLTMGLIQSVSSQNPSVVAPFTASGEGTNALTLSVIGEGSTALTVKWTYQGQSQTSVIGVHAVAR